MFGYQMLDEIYEFTQGEKDEWDFPKVNPGTTTAIYTPLERRLKLLPRQNPMDLDKGRRKWRMMEA